ncbi:MAG TPA: response regulator transcription factor [Puia sp.]|nr:response regulator transcription factor [Puia sp.]
MISILILNYERLVREGWKDFLGAQPGISVVGCTGDPKDAIAIAAKFKPRIVLAVSDLVMGAGVHELRAIYRACSDTRMILISRFYPEGVRDYLGQIGVRACLSKDSSLAEILLALSRVNAGITYTSDALRIGSGEVVRSNEMEIGQLTQRELQIAGLLRLGKTSKEIAQLLNVSYKTIEVHRFHILKKLGCRNTMHLCNKLSQQQMRG